MNATSSGVASSEAKMRSPSFSRSSSSMTTTGRPLLMAAIASSTLSRRTGAVTNPPRSRSSAPCPRVLCSCVSSPARSRAGSQQAFHVLGDHVDLHVDRAPGRDGTQRGLPQRGGDQADLEPRLGIVGGADGAHGQRDAVHGDRALLDDVARQLRRQPDPHDLPVLAGGAGDDGADAVDVALHQVPAEAPVRGNGPLQVDRVAGAQGAQAAATERLGHHVGRPLLAVRTGDRETDAVDGDRVAQRHALEPLPGPDAQPGGVRLGPHPADLLAGEQGADLLDDAGEHDQPPPVAPWESATRRTPVCRVGRSRISTSPPRRVRPVTWRVSASPIPVIPRSSTSGAPAPSSLGARCTTTSSTSPARRKAAASVGPPSTSTRRTPRANSSSSSSRGPGAPLTRVGAASSSTRAVAGSRPRRSSTTRSGCRGASRPSASRTVSCGSSVSAVPDPTTTASQVARSRWTAARASGPVTQRLLPSAAATRPSSVPATFQTTNGRCSRTPVSHAPSAPSSAACCSTPSSTSMLAARSRAAPPPASCLGSGTATTTRATPAATSASVHGPVRPVCAHGSRVTTAVPPRARPPAWTSARTSACGPPGGAVAPSPTVVPSAASTTAPTAGFGPVVPRTPVPSSRARAMAESSAAETLTPAAPRRPARGRGGPWAASRR